jgi:hypothetical protein
MNKHSIFAAAGLISALLATPALAEKSDRVFVEEMRSRIAAARSETNVAQAGAADLAQAERRLPELAKALDDNEAEDARASRNGIEALIAAARLRARTVSEQPQAQPAHYTPPAPTKRVHRAAHKPAKPKPAGCTLASR